MGSKKWYGMNWIRKEKRLSGNIAHGMACTYCGFALEDGAQLHLDHITPRSQGGTNDTWNLVTACAKCNTSRQDRPIVEWCEAVAHYVDGDVTGEEIYRGVVEMANRDWSQYLPMAKELMANRPTWQQAQQAAVEVC